MIVPKESRKKFLKSAALRYHHQLLEDEVGMKYLTAERQITREAILHFGLGVVRQPEQGHEIFQGRLSFPYVTMTGVTSIRFRFMGDHAAVGAKKFLYEPGDTPRLYNVKATADQGRIFVCEGETDTVAAWQAGLLSVGVPGATSWKSAFARVLRNRDVTVLADNDDGGEGQKFAAEVSKSLDGCDILLMEPGHDVASYMAEFGTDALRKKVGL